MRASSLSNLL